MVRKGSGTRGQRQQQRRGSRRSWTHKGGFYPSVMSGLVGAGSLLTMTSLRQAYTLLENDRTRMLNRLRTRRRKPAHKPGLAKRLTKRT